MIEILFFVATDSPHKTTKTALIPKSVCVLKPAGLFQLERSMPINPAKIIAKDITIANFGLFMNKLPAIIYPFI